MRTNQTATPASYTAPQSFSGLAPGGAAVPATRSKATGPLLVGATVAMGLMAGLFFAFDVSVMPGLAASDDKTYVTAMQHINKSIENGMFGLVFVGAFVATGVAAWLLHKAGRRQAALWAALATALYVVALMVTMGVNIPLNNQLAAAGDPSQIQDLASVRAHFADSWVPANMLRTALCTGGLLALTRSLVLHGRSER
ncbi:anthrone oxygenase family protein [Kitasatospora sp. NPDC097691]|uniref:anthrone oxygenase family protein n=1 Tax=Kitasatospora sp. NPDC097691 TaxID=3157231 RepID=UPI00331C7674